MRNFATLILMTCFGCAVADVGELNQEVTNSRLNPRLQPLAFTLGAWACEGDYETVPPFTVAHHNVALAIFAPSVNGEWVTARFQEFVTAENPRPASTIDSMTISPTNPGGPDEWNGLRTLVDDKTGQLQGTFLLTEGLLRFSGTYLIAGIPVPFIEIVRNDGQHFETVASILNPFAGGAHQVFLTERCTRL